MLGDLYNKKENNTKNNSCFSLPPVAHLALVRACLLIWRSWSKESIVYLGIHTKYRLEHDGKFANPPSSNQAALHAKLRHVTPEPAISAVPETVNLGYA
jgi:hypothetical protein